ncbi:YiiX/YebB-like N1pC/P60 family cysteine hydrolase [Bosea sp. LjRoot237]|uniref:YiiX/YebB-like N1pC/P60 family cysteine hydrolase n=1 Tax=Bosea sp. LjRoot237 TaxID=3342292 RepID=UPI003ED0B9BA
MIELHAGDILFQDIGCGAICDAINGVAPGYRNAEINHCGIIYASDSDLVVLEAIYPYVRETAVGDFMKRSVDDRRRPRIMIGRTSELIRPLVPPALAFCRSCVGQPYDALFSNDDTSFYCSEIIVDGFRAANGGSRCSRRGL